MSPTKNEIDKKARQATIDYLLKYFSKDDYTTYLKINDRYSSISCKVPLGQISNNAISEDWISEIEIKVEVNINNYQDFFTIDLRKDFTVKEKIAYYRKGENLTEQLITSLKYYMVQVRENKLLSPDTVFKYVEKNYPDKKWSKPKISRSSFPPYQFYYEVMEADCSPCKKVFIDLIELKKIGDNNVEMIPINK